MSQPCIFIAAGGTGGHIFPALTVADLLKKQGQSVVWLGSPGRLEEKIVPKYGYPIEYLNIGALRGRDFSTLLKAPFKVVQATLQAWRLMRDYQPRVVLAMGGYVTGPVGLAAKLAGVPLMIHEQNAFAGLTNRWLQKIADETFVAYVGALSTTADHVIGNPVRDSLTLLPTPEERFKNRDNSRLRLLVLGGSQGAKAINTALLALWPQFDLSSIELIHQTGSAEHAVCEAAYAALQCFDPVKHQIVPFIDEMDHAYAWADLVLARAGAMTVAEVSAVGLAAIYVPFPEAVDDHQTHNCLPLVKLGAARLLAQKDLTPATLGLLLSEFYQKPAMLLEMAQLSRQWAKPTAASVLADFIMAK